MFKEKPSRRENLYILFTDIKRGGNDAAIVPNVGMFASFDPVALDMACVDAVNAQPVIANSMLGDCHHDHDHHPADEHFHAIHPDTNWMSCLEHAEKIGLGSRSYELIKI